MHPMEKELIRRFVVKHKQARIIWELSDPKRRSQVFFHRFAHSQVMDRTRMSPVGYLSEGELEQRLLALGGGRDAYVLGESFIGPLPLKQALRHAQAGTMCVIYCGNGVGYYQGEQTFGAPPRFLLISKQKGANQ